LRFLALILVLLAAPRGTAAAPRHDYLVSWGMEAKSSSGAQVGRDFLAVFDMGDPAHFGQLVAMLPVPTQSQMAHHANYEIPANGMLFANDFLAAHSYVFDLRNPLKPSIAASFDNAGPYTHPHSFAYLSTGHTLATYQQKGSDDTVAGALVELDGKGAIVRMTDASDTQVEPFIRPYSLLVLEKIDRVVTTSADMMPSTLDSHVVQVWRLSDLKLLKTVVLPKPAQFQGAAANDPNEARVLSDGSTVLVQTARCGLFRLGGLSGTNPTARFVYDLGYRSCSGVPVVIGHYWIEPSASGHCVTALDVNDPAHPVEVSRVWLGAGALPHWLAREPRGHRIVITGQGSLKNLISFASLDVHTGALKLDRRTISFNRKWPDGWNGAAVPHAALFYPR
jgi:hypothetical protein